MAPPFHCVVSPWTLWFTVAVLGVWSVSFDFGWHPLLLFRRRDHGVDHRIRVRNLTGVLRRHLLLMLINELLIINNCHLAFEEYRNVTPTYLHTLIIVNRLNRLLSNTRDPNFRSFQIQIYIKKKKGVFVLEFQTVLLLRASTIRGGAWTLFSWFFLSFLYPFGVYSDARDKRKYFEVKITWLS